MKRRLEAIWRVITSEHFALITERIENEDSYVTVIAVADVDKEDSIVTSVIKALQNASDESDS